MEELLVLWCRMEECLNGQSGMDAILDLVDALVHSHSRTCRNDENFVDDVRVCSAHSEPEPLAADTHKSCTECILMYRNAY